jgi:hypothetical protein
MIAPVDSERYRLLITDDVGIHVKTSCDCTE